MCDKLEGWMLYNDVQQVVVGLIDTRLIGANDKRVGLVLFPASTNRFSVSWKGAAILDTGLTLVPNQNPFILRHADFGCSIHEEMRVISSGATTLVNYIEIMLRQDMQPKGH